MHNNTRISGFVPAAAAAYCEELLNRFDFELKIVKPRRTRLGDFISRPFQRPRITVNADLNPYSFLITYLHEVAHCAVYRTVRKKVPPHGKEWKTGFRQLLMPVLNTAVFPEDVLNALLKYTVNPAASTAGAPWLMEALKKYDNGGPLPENKTQLRHLPEGAPFVFQGREFIKGSLRRTRVLCTDRQSRRRYTIPEYALVEKCS